MWPFRRSEKLDDPVTLPEFGSTEDCPACGGMVFQRQFDRGFWEVGLRGGYIKAICLSCGWCGMERMKAES